MRFAVKILQVAFELFLNAWVYAVKVVIGRQMVTAGLVVFQVILHFLEFCHQFFAVLSIKCFRYAVHREHVITARGL